MLSYNINIDHKPLGPCNSEPLQTSRSSHLQMLFKIGCLKNLVISTGNTCSGVSFYKTADLKAYNFIKKRPQHRCFPVSIAKFLRTPFFTEHWWLLLPNLPHHRRVTWGVCSLILHCVLLILIQNLYKTLHK